MLCDEKRFPMMTSFFLVSFLTLITRFEDVRCASGLVSEVAYVPLLGSSLIQTGSTTVPKLGTLDPSYRLTDFSHVLDRSLRSALRVKRKSGSLGKQKLRDCAPYVQKGKFAPVVGVGRPVKKRLQAPGRQKDTFNIDILSGLRIIKSDLLSKENYSSSVEFQLFQTLEASVYKMLNVKTVNLAVEGWFSARRNPQLSAHSSVGEHNSQSHGSLNQWNNLLQAFKGRRKEYSRKNSQEKNDVLGSKKKLHFISSMHTEGEMKLVTGIREENLQFITRVEAILFAAIDLQYKDGKINEKRLDAFFHKDNLVSLGMHIFSSYQIRSSELFEPSLSFLRFDPNSKYIHACLEGLSDIKKDFLEFTVLRSTISSYAFFCFSKSYQQSRRYEDIIFAFISTETILASRIVSGVMSGFTQGQRHDISNLIDRCTAYQQPIKADSNLPHDMSTLNMFIIEHISNFLVRLLEPGKTPQPRDLNKLYPVPSNLYFSRSEGLCRLPSGSSVK